MSHLLCSKPFWAHNTTYGALDILAASAFSRSSKLGSVCPGTHSVHPQLFSLCPVQDPAPCSYRKSGPLARRPWSHLGVDFVTNLPNSEGHTCILVAVDRFFKACKLILLKGLPTAMETAETASYHGPSMYKIPSNKPRSSLSLQ